ncbi:hypothetical protein ADK53_24555 [Streptomyces sp. WM6373]|nr:hypothetical protein ADK53_24555 [Streptomyces sp. WM6373]KOU86628.1 hypothetical protein ADK93_19310 [Streptomyces sp. XY58]KOV09726.1 hypothetical protein ADK89_06365 [Streptomyces sp. XY37]KOV29585.1 hypothetical protein ADK97_31755 [Streptomyces sp. H021]KOV47397.1 hypothetical protein ADK99_19745 [Streptomyces sp. MMG1064]
MLCTTGFLAVMGPSVPASAAVPPSCRVGAYVTDLYGLDVSPRTIKADFWLWSVCPTDALDATRRLEFVNATDVTQSDRSVVKVGDEYWSQVKVSGTFRQQFDLSEYPFDKQDVKIQIEDSEYNASQFTYVADSKDSGYDHAISLGGFKIRDFGVGVVEHTYRTSFGDPRITHGQNSQYSQFVIDLKLERDDLAGFIRQAWPAYVAFLISFISYWIWASDFITVVGARFGILGASLFSVVVSMRAASLTGTSFGVTLVDQIHLATLLYTLVGVGCTSYILYKWVDPEERASVRRTNTVVALSTTAVFLIANAVSIGFAVT